MSNYKALQRSHDHKEDVREMTQENEDASTFITNFEYALNEIISDDIEWDDITSLLRKQLEKAENRDIK